MKVCQTNVGMSKILTNIRGWNHYQISLLTLRFDKFFWLLFQTWNWRHFHFCSSFCDISRKATTATEMVDVICIIDFLHRATALFLFLCSHKVTEDLTWFSVELWPELAKRETPVFYWPPLPCILRQYFMVTNDLKKRLLDTIFMKS